MKHLLSLFIGFVVLWSSTVYAGGKHYWLADAGMLLNQGKNDNPAIEGLVGLTYGYGFNSQYALEVDYLQSIFGGKYSKTLNPPVSAVSLEDGQYSHWMSSVNGVYRHLFGKMFYLKAKLGFMFGQEHRSTNVPNKSNNSSIQAIDGGLGGGVLLGPVLGTSSTLELNYTQHNQKLMSFTLGLNVTF